ncbi:MAG: hypothetical protein ACR2NA_09700 [Solirubrobacterales bacterium]
MTGPSTETARPALPEVAARPLGRGLTLIRIAGILAVAIIFLIGMGGVESKTDSAILDLFDLNAELRGQGFNFPVLFSAGLLFAAGLLAFAVSRADGRGRTWPWALFGALLVFMTADELFEIHERLEFATGVDWQQLYAPLAVVAGVVWLWAWTRMDGVRGLRIAWVAGGVAWFVAQALEGVQWNSADELIGIGPILQAIEEMLEMAGSATFGLCLAALLLVLRTRRRTERPVASPAATPSTAH